MMSQLPTVFLVLFLPCRCARLPEHIGFFSASFLVTASGQLYGLVNPVSAHPKNHPKVTAVY
jgi:hypothetical protein